MSSLGCSIFLIAALNQCLTILSPRESTAAPVFNMSSWSIADVKFSEAIVVLDCETLTNLFKLGKGEVTTYRSLL